MPAAFSVACALVKAWRISGSKPPAASCPVASAPIAPERYSVSPTSRPGEKGRFSAVEPAGWMSFLCGFAEPGAGAPVAAARATAASAVGMSNHALFMSVLSPPVWARVGAGVWARVWDRVDERGREDTARGDAVERRYRYAKIWRQQGRPLLR